MSGGRFCFGVGNRGYCGRMSGVLVSSWDLVRCSDCHAARRADEHHQVGVENVKGDPDVRRFADPAESSTAVDVDRDGVAEYPS
jgi:hypothetical protein